MATKQDQRKTMIREQQIGEWQDRRKNDDQRRAKQISEWRDRRRPADQRRRACAEERRDIVKSGFSLVTLQNRKKKEWDWDDSNLEIAVQEICAIVNRLCPTVKLVGERTRA